MSNQQPSSERLAEASFLIRHGRSSEGIPILDIIVDGDPTNAWALEERGRAKLFVGDHEGAIADFSRMISQWPGNSKGFTCRARARAHA